MIGIHVRIENTVHQEIEQMAQARGITPSQLTRELIDIGLRVKKHMDNKKPGQQDTTQLNIKHVEIGASSAIETLGLMRRLISETHPEWIEEAHKEAKEKVKKFREQN